MRAPRVPLLVLCVAAALLPELVCGGHGHGHGHGHSHGNDDDDHHAHRHSHGHGEGATDAASMSLYKIGAMLSIVAIKVGFGLAPRYFKNNDALLNLANAFSAGIFLAAGLCHLLPEAAAAFEDLPKAWQHTFPEHVAFPCCGVGFMLTLLLERVLLASSDHGHAHAKKNVKDSDDEGVEMSETGHSHDSHGHSHGAHGHCHMPASLDPNQALLPMVLTAILSFHSFMGGIALGVQSDAHQAFLVWLAIVTHKWVEAFSLGVNFVASGLSHSAHCKFLIPFAASSPAGIAFGWAVHSAVSEDFARVCVAVLDAVASGTFIYIATVDLIAEGISGRSIVTKYVSLVAGFFGFVVLSASFHQPH
eukprot:Tamp_20414.p1 GENE.Tamp_20414~~Tamp_20414.p1  ORF type:complete len:362 (+),score=53.33 Tamp_20414:2-1087(+)